MSVISIADPQKIQYFVETELSQTFRTVADAWKAWLINETSSTGSIYDLEMKFLGNNGRTGSLYDRWRQECIANGYTQEFPEALNNYFNNPGGGGFSPGDAMGVLGLTYA